MRIPSPPNEDLMATFWLAILRLVRLGIGIDGYCSIFSFQCVHSIGGTWSNDYKSFECLNRWIDRGVGIWKWTVTWAVMVTSEDHKKRWKYSVLDTELEFKLLYTCQVLTYMRSCTEAYRYYVHVSFSQFLHLFCWEPFSTKQMTGSR